MACLTPRQERFVQEYLVDLNATQAAIRAGYSKRRASEIGHQQLLKPAVAEAIAAAKKERSERVQVDADYVVRHLVNLVELSMQKKPCHTMKGEQESDENGNPLWTAVDGKSAARALELLARHVGMLKDKLELTHAIDPEALEDMRRSIVDGVS